MTNKVIELAREFCDDAVEIMLVLNGNFLRQFRVGEESPRFDKEQVFSSKEIDFSKMEIHRSIVCNNGDILFTLDIDFHDKQIQEGLALAKEAAQKIEDKFPGMFLWSFSGRNIHGHAYIRYNKSNEQHVVRYGRIYDFCKSIIFFMKNELYVDLDDVMYHYKGTIKSMGSYHKVTGLYKIPITLDMGIDEILTRSATFDYDEDYKIPDLDVDLIRKVVPIYGFDFKKTSYMPNTEDKVPVDMAKYPSCMLQMMNIKTKGNKIRYDLLRYFFFLHKKSDAKKVMRLICTTEEFNHMMREKQFDMIYARNYPPPTAAYIEGEYGFPCDRVHPTILNTD